MFSTRDLSGFVSYAAEALRLKFGKREYEIVLCLHNKFESASLLPSPTIVIGAIIILYRAHSHTLQFAMLARWGKAVSW